MNCIIVGAGPAGLSAGWKLSKLKNKVIIIEKDSEVGGNARTIWSEGFGFDYGPHNFHTQHRDILEFLKIIITDGFLQRKIKPLIYFRNKWVPYPLTGLKVFTSIPLFLSFLCCLDFLFTRFKNRLVIDHKEIKSFEDWVVHNFGKKLFNIYFKPYATKVWGIPTKELSKAVGEKRVPALSLWSLALQTFGIIRSNHPEDPRTLSHYYPPSGIGVITNTFKREIEDQGGDILLNASVEEIKVDGDRVTSVYSTGSKFSCDLLLWTGSIIELVKLLKENIDKDLINLANSLSFRSEHLLFLKINKTRVLNSPFVYFSSPKVPFTRVYENSIFSPQMSPAGKTGLCIEFTCMNNDRIWSSSSEKLLSLALAHLEAAGLLKEKDIIGHFSRRIEHAYPIYSIDYDKKISAILKGLQKFKNVLSFGRLGMFLYINVDEAIRMGFKAADLAMLNIVDRGYSYIKLYKDYVRY